MTTRELRKILMAVEKQEMTVKELRNILFEVENQDAELTDCDMIRLTKEEVQEQEDAMQALQVFVDGYGLGISKEKLVIKAYYSLSAKHDCYTINGRYISIDGKEFQLIKSRKQDRWIVKEF